MFVLVEQVVLLVLVVPVERGTVWVVETRLNVKRNSYTHSHHSLLILRNSCLSKQLSCVCFVVLFIYRSVLFLHCAMLFLYVFKIVSGFFQFKIFTVICGECCLTAAGRVLC